MPFVGGGFCGLGISAVDLWTDARLGWVLDARSTYLHSFMRLLPMSIYR